MIRFKKVKPNEKYINIGKNTRTKVLDTGVTIETTVALMEYCGCPITKLDADHYKLKRTGEIKEFKHNSKRTDNLNSISLSMKKLRDVINYNVTDTEKVTWLTLTYAENMQDYKRLYDDFRKFNMRFRYYCKKNGLPHYEYIAVCEPQLRGAWHMHVILLWDEKAPFIANNAMASIWGHGFTKTTAIKNNSIDNLGYYLSSYLSDLPLDDEALQGKMDYSMIKERDKKKFLKAGRLKLYPVGMKFYRCSKGIKKPEPYYLPKYEADKLLERREAFLMRKTYTYIYDDNKNRLNAFSMLSQHCYFDTRDLAREKYRLKKAYNQSRYYRNLWKEMLELSEKFALSNEYSY